MKVLCALFAVFCLSLVMLVPDLDAACGGAGRRASRREARRGGGSCGSSASYSESYQMRSSGSGGMTMQMRSFSSGFGGGCANGQCR